MRAKRITQTSLFGPESIEHPIADDLEAASAWLDAHPELLDAGEALGWLTISSHELDLTTLLEEVAA